MLLYKRVRLPDCPQPAALSGVPQFGKELAYSFAGSSSAFSSLTYRRHWVIFRHIGATEFSA